MQSYQSQFSTQWAEILNPTVRNGKVYVNAGYYGGVVYAFNLADGAASWNASGGTYGMNTPAADDDFAYAYNGSTLNVFNAADGSLFTSIGPNPDRGGRRLPRHSDARFRRITSWPTAVRQPTARSTAPVAGLLGSGPGDAVDVDRALQQLSRGSEGRRLCDVERDAHVRRARRGHRAAAVVVEAGGAVLQLHRQCGGHRQCRLREHRHQDLCNRPAGGHRTVWSAPTPGTMSISANRMLFVSSPYDSYSLSRPHHCVPAGLIAATRVRPDLCRPDADCRAMTQVAQAL